MDRFIKLNEKDKSDAYRIASAGAVNLSEELIEKDFWVCWILDLIFNGRQLSGFCRK